jgi:phage terminase large subunit GpA-like protein
MKYKNTLNELRKRVFAMLKSPPELSMSEWADRFRRLSPEASAEFGSWNTSRAEYQRGIMDAISDPTIETIVVMSSAQVGKTEMTLNMIGYYVHNDPSPMLVIQPTLDMAQTFSRDRLAPMVRDTPVLTELIQDSKSRSSGNTILKKSFPGGHITMAGSNSPASLASRPVRLAIFDETDRFPVSAGTEGDPVMLASKRTNNFANRKIIMVSTPTIQGASRIETAYENSDRRVFKVPCPHCGEFQQLKWSNVKFDKENPSHAFYVCDECGVVIEHSHKAAMVRQGKWVATLKSGKVAGFHLSELYSPWRTWGNMAEDFLFAKKNRDTLQVWINTALGEVFDDDADGDGVEYEQIYVKNRHEYEFDPLPEEVLVISAGVDVQGDRLELETLGHGLNEETWSLGYYKIPGDPGLGTTWDALDDILSRKFNHPSGIQLSVAATCVDSGGHHTQAVYDYTRRHTNRFAIKGASQSGKPLVGKPSRTNKGRVALYPIGTDAAKDLIFSRLKIEEFGSGFCHFPMSYDQEYFKGLCSEKKVRKFVKGVARMEWKKTRTRNEPLDLRVYAIAAFRLLNANLKAIDKKINGEKEEEDVIEPNVHIVAQEKELIPMAIPPKRRSRSRRGSAFVKRW